jgi:hypothetical protein
MPEMRRFFSGNRWNRALRLSSAVSSIASGRAVPSIIPQWAIFPIGRASRAPGLRLVRCLLPDGRVGGLRQFTPVRRWPRRSRRRLLARVGRFAQGLSRSDFRNQFGSTSDCRFRQLDDDIRRRIKQLVTPGPDAGVR